MGEYAGSIRSQASMALRILTHQECTREADPVIELISHLMELEPGESQTLSAEFVATDEWIRWNRLIAERPRAMRTAITATLERERPTIPPDVAMMQAWAVTLVLSTLDRLLMM